MDRNKIAKKLVTLRKDAGLTQDKLSEITGINRSTLAMYELGERIPNDDNKIRLSKAYETTVEKIFYI